MKRYPEKPEKLRVKQNNRRILLLKKMKPQLQLKVGHHQRRSLRILCHQLFQLYHSLDVFPSLKKKRMRRRSWILFGKSKSTFLFLML